MNQCICKTFEWGDILTSTFNWGCTCNWVYPQLEKGFKTIRRGMYYPLKQASANSGARATCGTRRCSQWHASKFKKNLKIFKKIKKITLGLLLTQDHNKSWNSTQPFMTYDFDQIIILPVLKLTPLNTNLIKNKFRTRLTNEHLEDIIRISTTQYKPDFAALAMSSRCHFSHKSCRGE